MESVKVKDHMNHRPVWFKGTETVVEAVEKLLQSKSSGGAVVNENKQVVGFLSEQDCLKAMLSSTYHSGEASKCVAEVMSTETQLVKPYDSILAVAEDMLINKPRVYPVVDDDGHLVGSLTRTLILSALDKHLHSIYEKGSHFV
ncbi:CBS domain-containing protein [Psychrosphaera haliotis]|mgnify:FL=1|uniref:CBS domain-containing protein n=1 Tax=Psychrosphaera haliotis TaxID=555083 RepID=A0A6N8F4Q0_9GAMM|nr:CBS domain-containing protein [Psychrosphaera haliotis]MDB2374523.1 CBS domain-containing protein [Psychrosphaera haliotis]MUH71134.1 CBS domain-containing protein [Psychrosphaera haliotis]